jgi:hypothetical protein
MGGSSSIVSAAFRQLLQNQNARAPSAKGSADAVEGGSQGDSATINRLKEQFAAAQAKLEADIQQNANEQTIRTDQQRVQAAASAGRGRTGGRACGAGGGSHSLRGPVHPARSPNPTYRRQSADYLAGDWEVHKITGHARRTVGRWPVPKTDVDEQVSALLAASERAADEAPDGE